jgi:hypothetical protein
MLDIKQIKLVEVDNKCTVVILPASKDEVVGYLQQAIEMASRATKAFETLDRADESVWNDFCTQINK